MVLVNITDDIQYHLPPDRLPSEGHLTSLALSPIFITLSNHEKISDKPKLKDIQENIGLVPSKFQEYEKQGNTEKCHRYEVSKNTVTTKCNTIFWTKLGREKKGH